MTMQNMAAFHQHATGQGINTPEYLADEFRMYQFKVIECQRDDQHDWCECPFLHPGEKVRRRDPKAFTYSSQACESFRKTGQCKNGDDCTFAHGVFECRLHPQRYKTEMCSDGDRCNRRICFFAHNENELRVLSPRSAFVINRGGQGNNMNMSNSHNLHGQTPASLGYRSPQMPHDQSTLMDLPKHQMYQYPQVRLPRPPPPTPGTRSPPSPFESAHPHPPSGAPLNHGAPCQAHSQSTFNADQHELLLYLAEAVQGLLLQSSTQASAARLNGGSSSSQVSSNESLVFNPQPPPPTSQHQGILNHHLHNAAPTPESLAKAVQSLMLMQGVQGQGYEMHRSALHSPPIPASFSPNTPSPISQLVSAQQKQTPPTDASSASAFISRHLELLKNEKQNALQQTDSFELLLSQIPRFCPESSINLNSLGSFEGKRE